MTSGLCATKSDVGFVVIVLALPQSVAAMLALPLMRAAASRHPDIVLHVNED